MFEQKNGLPLKCFCATQMMIAAGYILGTAELVTLESKEWPSKTIKVQVKQLTTRHSDKKQERLKGTLLLK